jgi:hypothetical protein
MVVQRDYPSLAEFELEPAPSRSSGAKFFAASFVCAVLALVVVCYQEQIEVVRLVMFCIGFSLLVVFYLIIYALLTQTPPMLVKGVLICIGLVILASLVPTNHIPRGAAHRAQCQSHLKQIGLALQNYHDIHRLFPHRVLKQENEPALLSWRVSLMPYLESNPDYQKFHQDEPWNSQHNAKLIQHMPTMYRCPSEPNNDADKYHTSYLAISGKDTMWPDNESITVKAVADGTANTVLVMESHCTGITWSEPRDQTANQLLKERRRLRRAGKSPSTNHPGGSMAVMVDGSTRYIPASIDPQVLEQILNRHDGEPKSTDW